MEKNWVSFRIEEMEEKAGLDTTPVEYPLHDMDGSYFVPHITDEDMLKMDDAYHYSLSHRLHYLINTRFEEGD